MDEMIERVKAVLRAEAQGQFSYEVVAQAVFKAMRDPTPKMIEAAHGALAGDGEIVDVYQAMIDAASNTIPIINLSDIDSAD